MSFEFTPQNHKDKLISIVNKLATHVDLDEKHLQRALHKYNKAPGKVFTKNDLQIGVKWLIKEGLIDHIDKFRIKEIKELIKMKPMRTQSGVAIVTVLTKPFPCPGKCIFCPNDVRMPKSYLRDEPGAQRAERNSFDPYLQVYNRLLALKNIGHPTDKVELIVLGGTWSYYPEAYQVWFIKRCFEAMNDFGNNDQRQSIKEENIFENADKNYSRIKPDGTQKTYNELIAEIRHKEGDLMKKGKVIDSATWEELIEQQKINVTAQTRCVGLVVETRPDSIDVDEVIRIRKLGCTKVQLGIQTLNDEINDANKRGHHASHVRDAFRLLRRGGFKIHGHLMPNLYLATPESDLNDSIEIFESKEYRPDELKIYPTSVIKNTELYDLWEKGEYEPYDHETLVNLLAEMIVNTPPYCRLTRVIRDIPSTDIEAGNKFTNLRQLVEEKIRKEGKQSNDIRWREIRNRDVTMDDLRLDKYEYETTETKEIFMSYVTNDDFSIAGFLRLSLPKFDKNQIFDELDECAIIREIHVYGQMINIGNRKDGKAQHLGLGTKLINKAKRMARDNKFKKLAVISSIGTREYYQKRGFKLVDLYQIAQLD